MAEILLLGKGISNNALHQFLMKYGIEHDFLKLEEINDFNYDLVIKGPGIFYQEEVIQKFLEKNVMIVTDIEFIYWFLNKEYIAVTGTNGKTTTTYLINDILNLKYSSIACGNCGFPISQAALEYKLYKYFVLELSSFQLKGVVKFTPKIAVVTNIKHAHLDYHGSVEDYYKSKYNITKNQSKNDFLILNLDDEVSMQLFKNSDANKVTFSLNNKNSDCYIKKNTFIFKKEKIINKKLLKNKTEPFYYDVLAAICACKIVGIENKYIRKALKRFINVKYRFEEICKDIYNDAKSTNISSTISALKSLNGKDIYLICGGYDRKEDLTVDSNDFKDVKRIYAYGQTKDKLYNIFKRNKIDILVFENLKDATLRALCDRNKEVILYSPMFASYDQYKSFEERGKEFNKILSYYFKTKFNT